MITIAGGIGMYWLANHVVTIEDASDLAMWNAIVIGTPLLMAVFMSIHWVIRDKRPYLVVNLQGMEVSLPREGIRFPVGDPAYTFVHELFSVRGDDDVSEFNLVRDIGLNETSHPILRTLGRHSSFAKLGQTLQFAGLQFTARKTSC
jgi:hypothetical protein